MCKKYIPKFYFYFAPIQQQIQMDHSKASVPAIYHSKPIFFGLKNLGICRIKNLQIFSMKCQGSNFFKSFYLYDDGLERNGAACDEDAFLRTASLRMTI